MDFQPPDKRLQIARIHLKEGGGPTIEKSNPSISATLDVRGGWRQVDAVLDLGTHERICRRHHPPNNRHHQTEDNQADKERSTDDFPKPDPGFPITAFFLRIHGNDDSWRGGSSQHET